LYPPIIAKTFCRASHHIRVAFKENGFFMPLRVRRAALRPLTAALVLSGLCVGSVCPAFAQPPIPPAQVPQPPEPTPAPTQEPPVPDPASEPQPAEPQRERFRIGPELGYYLPSDSKAQDAFGSGIFNIGFGLGSIKFAREMGEFNFDLNFITARRTGSRLFMAPVGVAYRRSLTHITSTRQIVPYVGASANLFLVDIRADDYNVGGGLRTGAGASIFAGLNFGQSAYLQARYYGFSKIAGFQLSGTNLSLGFRF
jgi:hypothetical protein